MLPTRAEPAHNQADAAVTLSLLLKQCRSNRKHEAEHRHPSHNYSQPLSDFFGQARLLSMNVLC
jgi:hypothetical protein